MGSSFTKLSSYFSKQDNVCILVFGDYRAGKTSVLHALKLGEDLTMLPIVGFDIETITAGNLTLTTWDVGGRHKIRPLWRHFFANTSGFAFVVDSHDRARMGEACYELHRMANEEESRNLPILIFANKQDLPNPCTLDEIKEKLNLSKLDEMKTKWHLQPSVATKNEGIEEGFRWLVSAIQSKTDYTEPIMETINDSKLMKNDLLSLYNSINLRTLISKFI